ncbi:MAG: hypothetical protein R3F20_07115 [Planctomycetota bacterium]
MDMKITRTLVLALATGIALAGSLTAQRTNTLSTGLGLGLTEQSRPEIAVLDEDRFCMVSPQILTTPAGYTHLVVVDRAVDGPFLHYVPIVYPVLATKAVWTRPVALDPTSVVLPSAGLDEVLRTSDDALIVFTGLDNPATAQQHTYPLPVGAPRVAADVIRVSPTELAWIDAGLDGAWSTGDEFVRLIHGLGPNMTVEDVTIPGGSEGHLARFEDGSFAIRGFGLDATVGTADDMLLVVRPGNPGDASLHSVVKVKSANGLALIGSRWPQPVGDHHVAMPALGDDNRFGTADDLLVLISTDNGDADDELPVGDSAWNFLFGPGKIGVESDDTIVMGGPGPDGAAGTTDDVIQFRPRSAYNHLTEIFSPGVTLVNSAAAQTAPDVVTLDADVSIVRHYGTSSSDTLNAGIIVFRKLAAGSHVFAVHNFGEAVRDIVPMTEDSAALFLESGTVYVGSNLNSVSPMFQILPGAVHTFECRPARVTPSAVVSISTGPATYGYLDDEIKIWRARAAWEYGHGTPNAAGWDMHLTAGGAVPVVGGSTFFLHLDDAPPSRTGYFLMSLERDVVKPAVDADILLSIESLFPPTFWLTLADGTTYFPIIPPTSPVWEGVRVHGQFVIFNPTSPRQYELSNGLTMQF